MSEITNTPLPRKRGKVVDFRGYTDQMLLGMKEDVGLELLLPELRAIRELYRRTLRRDAYLDELYMLDRLVAARRLTRTPINELFTDSAFIADTYADMQRKLSSLRRDAQTTCGSLIALPSRYLARAGKTTSLTGRATLMSGELSDIELWLRGLRTVAYTGSAALGRRAADAPQDISAPAGSLLVLVYPWGGIGRAQFGDALRGALAAPELQSVFPFALDGGQLDDGGIIEWLCSRGSGAYIDLATLSPIVGQVGVSGQELLAHPLNGAIIAALPADRVNEFMAAVYAKRLWTGIIGSLSSDGKISVNCGPITLSYPISALRQPAPGEARAITVACAEADLGTSPLCRARTETDILVSQQLHGVASPWAAHAAAMRAIADCVAGGADFTDVALSFKISAHPSPDGMSSVLGLLAAVYRVQLEYCCPDMGSSLTGTAAEPSLIVAAAAMLPEKPVRTGKASAAPARPAQTVPARIAAPGDLLYLLEPLRTEDGLTDHEDARRMWQYVSHMTSRGEVTAAIAIGADGVDAAMRTLLDDSLTLSPMASIPSSATPGALLIACRAPISGTMLGTVIEK